MAVDTAAKRLAMLNFGSDSVDALPAPDGTVAAADRAQHLGLYGGFTLGTGATTPLTSADPGVAAWSMFKGPRRIDL